MVDAEEKKEEDKELEQVENGKRPQDVDMLNKSSDDAQQLDDDDDNNKANAKQVEEFAAQHEEPVDLIVQDLPSHFRNPEISPHLRYGIPIFFVFTFGLLLASDLGSGVSAYSKLVNPYAPNQNNTKELLHASIFTSIKKLWNTGSYALAMLIVIASVSWPFIKIMLSLYAWFVPFTSRPIRRERLLEIIDALGKWSFVDIVVFTEITVAFRSTIYLGGPYVEIYVVPRWGLVGFVTANMLILIGTQMILYQHRIIIYGSTPVVSQDAPKGLLKIGTSTYPISKTSIWSLSFLITVGFVLYLWGCLVYIYRVINERGNIEVESSSYAITTIGRDLPLSAVDGGKGMYVWLSIIWYTLGMVFPLMSSVLFIALLWLPVSKAVLERLFFALEVVFAWSGSEVYVLSTVMAVAQLPTFGNGLINSGCSVCFVVTSQMFPELAIMAVGAVVNIVAFSWCFILVHPVIYHDRLLLHNSRST